MSAEHLELAGCISLESSLCDLIYLLLEVVLTSPISSDIFAELHTLWWSINVTERCFLSSPLRFLLVLQPFCPSIQPFPHIIASRCSPLYHPDLCAPECLPNPYARTHTRTHNLLCLPFLPNYKALSAGLSVLHWGAQGTGRCTAVWSFSAHPRKEPPWISTHFRDNVLVSFKC